jgi:hypothetical protein
MFLNRDSLLMTRDLDVLSVQALIVFFGYFCVRRKYRAG